jgi:uncharacterized delta-60 repeat protein
MLRCIALVALLLALAPAAARASGDEPDRTFGQRGTVTLKATDADAVGGAVKVVAGHKVLAGGSAAGKLVVLRLRKSGSLDSGFGSNGQVAVDLPGTSLDGVRSLATFRDGRILAAATVQPASGGTQIALVRFLPDGEIDPSFGNGNGYVITGPPGTTLGTMTQDKTGAILVAAGRPSGGGEIPYVARFAPDGTPDATFGAGGTVDGAALGLAGRATGVLARADGTIVFSVGAGADKVGPSAFPVVRLLANGAPDPAFGGTGVVSIPLTPYNGLGAGAIGVRQGPSGSVLVAGTDVTAKGSLRAAIVRLRPDGSLDPHFAADGVAHVARAGRDLRVTSFTRDNDGRIVLAGAGAPPDSLLARLTVGGRHDRTFGNRGITYPILGRPPGGDPVYTTLGAVDTDGSRVVTAGEAAGPGPLTRSLGGSTVFGGRFALTVSRLR